MNEIQRNKVTYITNSDGTNSCEKIIFVKCQAYEFFMHDINMELRMVTEQCVFQLHARSTGPQVMNVSCVSGAGLG